MKPATNIYCMSGLCQKGFPDKCRTFDEDEELSVCTFFRFS